MPNSASKQFVFTKRFKAVTTGWTWVKRERAKGQDVLSQLGWGPGEDKILPFITENGPAGTQT
jgi:hypothetical protein